MRVVTGIARGKTLVTLEGNDVRPTPAKVKEAVFSAIHFEIEGSRFLDLFSGCGQMGIEALSRGARFAVLADKSKASVEIIKRNLKSTGLEDNALVVLSDYSAYLSRCNEKFDFAFLDPPYDAEILEDALIKTSKVMSDVGAIICEHPPKVVLPRTIAGFTVNREYKYGKVNITVYKKEELP